MKQKLAKAGILTVGLIVCVLATSNVYAAKVVSISRANQSEQDSSQLQRLVYCSDDTTHVMLSSKGSKWCTDVALTDCDSSRLKLAQSICKRQRWAKTDGEIKPEATGQQDSTEVSVTKQDVEEPKADKSVDTAGVELLQTELEQIDRERGSIQKRIKELEQERAQLKQRKDRMSNSQ